MIIVNFGSHLFQPMFVYPTKPRMIEGSIVQTPHGDLLRANTFDIQEDVYYSEHHQTNYYDLRFLPEWRRDELENALKDPTGEKTLDFIEQDLGTDDNGDDEEEDGEESENQYGDPHLNETEDDEEDGPKLAPRDLVWNNGDIVPTNTEITKISGRKKRGYEINFCFAAPFPLAVDRLYVQNVDMRFALPSKSIHILSAGVCFFSENHGPHNGIFSYNPSGKPERYAYENMNRAEGRTLHSEIFLDPRKQHRKGRRCNDDSDFPIDANRLFCIGEETADLLRKSIALQPC